MSSERGSSFYLGFLALPPEKRKALRTVYAFCREVDDIVDSTALPPEVARRRLDSWRREIELAYEGRAHGSIARELQSLLSRFPFPKDAFLGLIDGVEMDVTPRRYETYAELEKYMTGVASCVGYLAIEIFGYTDRAGAREYARLLGHAFQLTNILRDVEADLSQRRLYLPLEDLRRFGLAEHSLRAGGPAFADLMRFEAARARSLYASARAALDPADRRSMRPAEVMAAVYEALLAEIERDPAQVLRKKIELPRWKKLAAALGGWWKAPTRRASYAQV